MSPRARIKKGAPSVKGQGPDAGSAALNLLSYRARSTRELREKLEEKGFEPSEIKKTIDWLTGAGYLNDEDFARERAGSRLRNMNWGTVKIAFELKTKGISPEIITRVLDEVDEDMEKEAAEKALEKWTRKNRAAIDKGGKGGKEDRGGKGLRLKAMRHLMGRGFKASVIGSALKDFREQEITEGE